jgi:putative peptide zinc metalloprotease protein
MKTEFTIGAHQEFEEVGQASSISARWGHLRPDLEVTHHRQHQRVLIREPFTGRVFAFSETAFNLIKTLDSELSLEEALARAFGSQPSEALLENVGHVFENAAKAGLLSANDGLNAAHANRSARSRGRWPNPFFIMIPLVNPKRLLRILRPFARPIFSRIAVIVWALVMATTIVMLAAHGKEYRASFALFRFARCWTVAYVLLFLATIIHEFGHAFASDRFGVTVRKFGLLLYVLMPGAYADISAAWLLPNPRERILISLGGVYLETYLWLGASWLWLTTGRDPVIHELAFISNAILALRILMNLIPFLRLDGYWVLVDLLGITNLRKKSAHYLLSHLPLIGHYWSDNFHEASRRQAIILASYGLASTAVTIYCIYAAFSNIHKWLLVSSPSAGESYFWIIVAAFSALAVPRIWRGLPGIVSDRGRR